MEGNVFVIVCVVEFLFIDWWCVVVLFDGGEYGDGYFGDCVVFFCVENVCVRYCDDWFEELMFCVC